MTATNYLTAAQVAARLGVTTDAVNRMCRAGQMPGAVQGAHRVWLIPPESARAARHRPGRGRPPIARTECSHCHGTGYVPA